MSASPPPVPRDVPEVQPDGRALRNWMNDLLRFLGTSGGTGTVTEVDTAAPITGGPITTSGTIAVSTMTGDSGAGGARGVVPAPAAGDAAAGKFLKADGTWTAPSGGGSGTVTSVGLTVPAEFSVSGSPVTGSGTLTVTKATESANTVWAGPTAGAAAQPTFRAIVAADLPNGNTWIFGDGRDGTVVFDGVNTFAFATLAASVYTLTDAVMATDCSISNGVTVTSGTGFPIFCKGTLTVNGTLQRNGTNAPSTTGGGAIVQNAWVQAGTVGTGGGTGTVAAGNAGANNTNSLGGSGGTGGTGSGGIGGAGGTATVPAVNSGGLKFQATLGMMVAAAFYRSSTAILATGGAGGGSGGGDGTHLGAGGGGGGCIVSIIASAIDNTATGTISALGGNGFNSTGAGNNTGGGGGGGGGIIRCITRTTNWRSGALTVSVAGGIGGTGLGTGLTGANGSPGTIIEMFVT